MPQSEASTPRRGRKAGLSKSKPNRRGKPGPRYSVGLPSTVASEVERYAETVDASMSKAIAALVGLGLESQANRKSTRLNSSHANISYAVFCLKKKIEQ